MSAKRKTLIEIQQKKKLSQKYRNTQKIFEEHCKKKDKEFSENLMVRIIIVLFPFSVRSTTRAVYFYESKKKSSHRNTAKQKALIEI